MEAMTRAQMRDAIRRRLGRTPAIDAGLAVIGDGLLSQPVPTNAEINAAIDEALAEINRTTQMGNNGEPLEFSISAQTDSGPYRMSLVTSTSQVPIQTIQQVRSAYWYDSSTHALLTPTSRDAMDRDTAAWMDTAAGTPEKFWIEGNYLNLYPAPSSAGTLKLQCTTDLFLAGTDSAFADQLPSDYHPVICDIAAALIASSVPDDQEMRSRLQVLLPRAEAGKGEILRWLANQSVSRRPQITVFSYRRGY